MHESPEVNLALDAAGFRSLEAGAENESARVWESPVPVVVLGRSGVISRDVHEEACIADGVGILRRDSGGGAVLLAPGCINYSLFLSLQRHPELRHIRSSYRRILCCLIRALALPELEVRGLSDLALAERKVSGNAQRRGLRALLHHGTLLYALDPRLMEKYLKPPVRPPDYRLGRCHTEFMGNLPLSAAQIRERLALILSSLPSEG